MSRLSMVMLVSLAAFMPAVALAQSSPTTTATPGPGTSGRQPSATDGSGAGGRMVPQAPVGHRQPRADERPAEMEKDASDVRIEQINRDANRSLRICRNC